MKKFIFPILIITFFLSSCSPRVTTSLTKNYPLLDNAEEVKVIEINEEVPQNAELLGEVTVDDSGFSTKCKYDMVIAAAKYEARKAGGNTIRILSHKNPDFSSSCHRIFANIYKIDYNAVAVEKNNIVDEISTDIVFDNEKKNAEYISQVRDTIEIINYQGIKQYMYKGEKLTADRFGVIVQQNPKAFEYYKKAKSTSGILNVLGYVSGFLIGYPIGTLIGGGQPNWTLAAIGGGIFVIALPISISAKNNVKKSIKIFNSQPLPTKNETSCNMQLGLNQKGLGFTICF